MTKRRRNPRAPRQPVELVLLPDFVDIINEVTQPSPYDHLQRLAQRASLQGKRRYPGAPTGVRRVRIPVMLPGGEVRWSDV